MKTIILTAVALATCGLASARGGSHFVSGHVTKNGTYVAPHYATDPNGTKLDNYSTKGNINSYTGKPGTVDPYQPKTPTQPCSLPQDRC